MKKIKKTEFDQIEAARRKLLSFILPNIDFDGWSSDAFNLAINDSGVDVGLAVQAAPRGAIDLAVAFHRQGDESMLTTHEKSDIINLRYSEKVAQMVWFRIEALKAHKEAVRRSIILFALPSNLNEGGKLIWNTVDCMWNALEDTSTDSNWYTKRATLSAVYSSTILFWLGDESLGSKDTWDFLDRRIKNVMAFEKTKAKIKETPIGQSIEGVLKYLKKPSDEHKLTFPGYRR